MSVNTIQLLASLLDVDCIWTAHEISHRSRLFHKTVLHILHDILRFYKSQCIGYPMMITEVQQWHHYASVQILLNHYQRYGDYFLGRILTMNETWTYFYEPCLKWQINEWKHPGSPRQMTMHYGQVGVKVMLIVAYDIHGHNAPCCTSKTDGKYCLLELEPFKLTAAQKPIIVQTHLHLIMCPPDLESNSFFPSSPDSVLISRGFTIPTQPPTCQLTLTLIVPRGWEIGSKQPCIKCQNNSAIHFVYF